MAIAMSQVELAAEMDKALASSYPGAHGTVAYMSEIIDRKCFHCDEDLGNTERPFYWIGTFLLIMHRVCFLDWLGRVLGDAKQSKTELYDTATLNGASDATELS